MDICRYGIRKMDLVIVHSFFLFLFLCSNATFSQPGRLNIPLHETALFSEQKSAFDRMDVMDEAPNEGSGSSVIHMDKYKKKEHKEVLDVNFAARFETIDSSIVKKYAPILHFHPNEGLQCCYPSSAENAYHRAKLGKTGKLKTPKSFETTTPCYFEALYTKNGFRIKYWFWYNYNDYPTGPNLWGNHPGDWEYLEIYFKNEQPYLYHFSNHKGVRIKYLNEISINNNQVEVWVGNGSHANYESATPSKIRSVLGFTDKVANGGATWNTAFNLVDIRNTNFCQEKYLGDWGDGKKIFGPLSRMSK